MELTTRRWSLFQALKAAMLIINKKATLPIIESVAIITKDKKYYLVATDLEVTYYQQIDISTTKKSHAINFVFEPMPVIKFLETIPKDIDDLAINIDMKDAMPGTMLLQAGFDEFSIPLMSTSEFPETKEIEDPESISIERIEFRTALKSALPFAGHDELRPVMTGVYLDLETEGGPYVVATDAHRLFRQKFSNVTVSNPEKNLSVIFSRKTILVIDKILDVDVSDKITITISGDKTNMKISDFEERKIVYARLIDGKYPNWRAVIPTERDRVVSFLTDDLKRRLSMVSAMTAVSKGCLLGFRYDKVLVHAVNLDTNQVYKATFDARATCQMNIGVNSSFMGECIDAVGTDVIHIAFSMPNRALVIIRPNDPEEEVLMLVMPVMADAVPEGWEVDADTIRETELLTEKPKKNGKEKEAN